MNQMNAGARTLMKAGVSRFARGQAEVFLRHLTAFDPSLPKILLRDATSNEDLRDSAKTADFLFARRKAEGFLQKEGVTTFQSSPRAILAVQALLVEASNPKGRAYEEILQSLEEQAHRP